LGSKDDGEGMRRRREKRKREIGITAARLGGL
jgi:hypothetical protein